MRLYHLYLLLLIPLAATAQDQSPRYVVLDRIVAVVNEDVIVQTELNKRMRTVLGQLRQQQTQPPPRDVLEKQVLERLVLSRLQLGQAKQRGIQVDDATVNQALRQIAGRNGLSLTEFREILAGDGYDFASFREDIRNELALKQLRERQIGDRIRVTDREVDNLLATQAIQQSGNDQYRLGHILIAVSEAPSPEEIAEIRAKADRVLAQLEAGADFRQTAVAVSDGRQALEGGDLGWRKANELPSLFADAVLNMKRGDVSELIRSPSGFHIVTLLDVRRAETHIIIQTHARHILIRPNELTSARDARIRLEQLRERIINGGDFAELARSHSADNGSAVNGGDLGWINPGDVVPQFQAAMDRLGPGEISEPFESPFGWHIVQVHGHRDHDSTEDVRRAKAKEAIRQRKLEDDVQAWLRRLRDEAYVEYRLAR